MVSQSLGGIVFGNANRTQRFFEFFTVSGGGLHFKCGGVDLVRCLSGNRLEAAQPRFFRLAGDGQLKISACFVELRLEQFQASRQLIFTIDATINDVLEPLEEIPSQHKPLIRIGGGSELLHVCGRLLCRFSVFCHGFGSGQERSRERRVKVGPADIGESQLQFFGTLGERTGLLLCDACSGRPRFEVTELSLVLLPRTVVVRHEHGDRRNKQGDGRHTEDDVQHLEIAPGLFCCGHDELFSSESDVNFEQESRVASREAVGPRGGCCFLRQKLSEISGILTMYFRLTVQRRIIFSGKLSIRSIRFAITM